MPELTGVTITEVECLGCGERIDYAAAPKDHCPECGAPWRTRG